MIILYYATNRWKAGYFVNTGGRNGNENQSRNYVTNSGKEYERIHRGQLKLFEKGIQDTTGSLPHGNSFVRRSNQFDETRRKHRFECYSYINDKFNHAHFSSGHNPEPGSFHYGYFDLEPNHLVFASKEDAYTIPNDSEIRAGEQSILANGEFSLEEINIANKISEDGYIPKPPNYIIAYKQIDENIYNESLRLKIPILLLAPRANEQTIDPNFTPYHWLYSQTSSIDSDFLSETLNNSKTK